MTTSAFIRRARLADVRSLCEIERLSFSTPWTMWCFLGELANPRSTILVAGPLPPEPWEVWGYLVFWLVADEMHILNLAVHPERRRRGVARSLLAAGLAQAQAHHATMAWLEVRPSNTAALALYQSFGFKEVGRRPGYYSDNGEDALIYALYWE
jgi:ribosomal-protein-alanine N-acetyltransferase|uniref:[Ribosomal protein bS18]-alanine N-acetyltransferase n=1 Tax=Desulfobacca acetoxidans TaxID=60893 RepID=A0A7C5ALA3_9BACT